MSKQSQLPDSDGDLHAAGKVCFLQLKVFPAATKRRVCREDAHV